MSETNWRATARVLQSTHEGLADRARKDDGVLDHALIHDAIVYLRDLSMTAFHRAAQPEAAAKAKLDPRHGKKTNVGDPNPKGPSGGGKKR